MRRVLSVLLVCILIATLVACAPNESETDELQQNITQLMERIQQLEDSSKQIQQQLMEHQKEKEFLQKKLDNLMAKPITFTAEAPVYGLKHRGNSASWACFRNVLYEGDLGEETYEDWYDDWYYDLYNYNPFEELLNCYINEIRPVIENDICMLDPCDGSLGLDVELSRQKEYFILVDGDGSAIINPTIEQEITLKDEVLGSGVGDWSVNLYLYFEPVYLKNPYLERTLKFGNNGTGIGGMKTYFNIYIGQTCIGTCYYLTNAYVSAKWFEDYFNNKNSARFYYGALS